MKNILLINSIIMTLALRAEARIGDSTEQCLQRYHDPSITRVGWSENEYRKGALVTSCSFRAKSCVWVRYSIIEASSVRSPSFKDQPQFTELQVKRLLALNAGESAWTKEGDDHQGAGHHGIYVTKDGERQAMVMEGLVIVELISYTNERRNLQGANEIDRVLTEFGADEDPAISTRAGKWTEPEKQKKDEQFEKEMEQLKFATEIQPKVNQVLIDLENLKKIREAESKEALPPGMKKR